ncbi:protein-L-isoaspartate O-methyltransferase [Erythrobacter sp. F6033]|uniref:protein-L-isoaspartate O-methyltransferase family protein n=1 Tax=Erythrobacter sp. F6033 TaxID=2926401 RepID=UPI001FF4F8B6|nr:protein-L-isoaspartate O-methyltransferase [Erythrobacter sp. F6033]MCK0129725.1 protein-L-isoaspartate O-methyltransferase [Erythrobacter sp. F6033]
MTTMTAPSESATARRAMIDSQLRTSGVNEEFALARMLAVPREDFLPEDKAAQAYTDRSIAIGEDAYLGSPLFYGKLLLEADPDKNDNVLIVEGGTGYLAELLRPLVGSIDTMSVADAAAGKDAKGGSYSLVVIDGAIEQLPDAIASCVAENGRIVSGLLLRQVTRLAAGRKVAGHLSLQPVEDIGIPVLHAFDKPKSWTF